MEKNCLTCKFEPDWSEPIGNGEYRRRSGKCKKKIDIQSFPATYIVQILTITRYSDNSGVFNNCPAYEKK